MKKLLIILLAFAFTFVTADAQILKRLGNVAKNAAERALERTVERKVEEKVEEHTSNAVDEVEKAITKGGKKDKKDKKKQDVESEDEEQDSDRDSSRDDDKGKKDYSAINAERRAANANLTFDDWDISDEDQSSASGNGSSNVARTNVSTSPQQGGAKQLELSYAKSDFVAGDEIIFDDQLVGEQLGEFPSMWDMLEGNIEVVKLNGENAIALSQDAGVTPYMEDPKNYLPESYTIEFEFFKGGNRTTEDKENYIDGTYHFIIDDADDNTILDLSTCGFKSSLSDHSFGSELEAEIRSTRGDSRYVSENLEYLQGWNRVSISFNKRALKVYVNGTRYVNAPNVAQGGWFSIVTATNGGSTPTFYIRNVRIAKGAVPLYDRMMSDGKFITYGITFDVGKSVIKPESMGEINRIVKLMTDNPNLKFSVEGHTDNTGNAASNQTLSEARSKAIVAKLVEMGIAADRLTSSGKGQNSPIADNSTDEGRAKNRRVEFVKL